MREYLISLAAVAAIAALTGLLTSDGGKQTGLQLAMGLCVLTVAVVPILSALQTLSDTEFSFSSTGDDRTEEYESIMQSSIQEFGGAYLAECLTKQLSERYSCPASEYSVRFTVSPEGDRVTSVLVLLSGKAAFVDTYDLERYVSGLFDCPCMTAIGSGT